MNETLKSFIKIAKKLKKEWKIIRVLYGKEQDPDLFICPNCRPFVIVSSEGKFENTIERIISCDESLGVKEFSFTRDFYNIVKEILPTRLRIAGDMCDILASSMNKYIIEAININVAKAGQPENIAFWSGEQLDLVHSCLDIKRCLFVPQKTGFSTGKTVISAHCAKELSKQGERVRFLYFPGLFVSTLYIWTFCIDKWDCLANFVKSQQATF